MIKRFFTDESLLTFVNEIKSYVNSAFSVKADKTHNHNSSYDAKGAAAESLESAKSYADSVANDVKNDLLNGAGEAYDTLKELGDLIANNHDAIEALETVASGKANKTHTHAISDVTNLQSALDNKTQVQIITWETND